MEQLRNDIALESLCHHGKQKGQKSEVYALEIEDIKKLANYFLDKEMWLHYMLFVVSCNMARRISDTLSLQWEHIFNPKTGDFRKDCLAFKERKTDKFANPPINSACRAAINLYIEKTGCDVSKDDYHVPMFMQLTGTHIRRPLSYRGAMNALKIASETVGIEDNIGTHSTRKTFGMMSVMAHPNDPNALYNVQLALNHSTPQMTEKYIGLTKKKIDAYYDDMGNIFNDYVLGDKDFEESFSNPIVAIDINDLRNIISAAYESGKSNSGCNDTQTNDDVIAGFMNMVKELQK